MTAASASTAPLPQSDVAAAAALEKVGVVPPRVEDPVQPPPAAQELPRPETQTLQPVGTPSPVEGAAMAATGEPLFIELTPLDRNRPVQRFQLIPDFSVHDMLVIGKAQRSAREGDYLPIIEAFPNIVADVDRGRAIELITTNPEHDGDRITFEELVRASNDAQEKLAARPSNR